MTCWLPPVLEKHFEINLADHATSIQISPTVDVFPAWSPRATAHRNTKVHVILDNYATHKTPAAERWLKRHPRYRFHFTPTSASWINQVERVFADLTEKQFRRGVFKNVAALEKAALDYITARNDDAKPFKWTADAATILSRVARRKELAASMSGH